MDQNDKSIYMNDYRSGQYPSPSISTGSPPNSRRTSTTVHSEYESVDDPLLCGCGGCTPGWLQYFHNAKWLLVMLGICAFVQSLVVNSIFPVGLSTLEKRFNMNRYVSSS